METVFIILGLIAAAIAVWFVTVKATTSWIDTYDSTNSKTWQCYVVFVIHMALTWPIFIYINRTNRRNKKT